MPEIFNYEVLNPSPDKSKPFVMKGILYYPTKKKYRYFLECARYGIYGEREYYILLGYTKFNQSCRICQPDIYNRVRIKFKGEINDYVLDTCKSNGNCEFTYIESTDDYDVYKIE